MWKGSLLIVVSVGILLGCGEDSEPQQPAAGGSGSSAGSSSGVSGTGSPSGGAGGSASSGAGPGLGGGGNANAGSAGAAPADQCALQGAFSASADMQLPQNTCNTLGSFKTIYDVTIANREITIEKSVEMFPMKGSIDGACQAEIIVQAPTYREFQLSFVPSSLTASGTYIDGDTSNCRSTYDASLKLTAK